MYSERVHELFHSRAHVGRPPGTTHGGEAGEPGRGPYVRLWLRVEEGAVREAGFKTYGCPAAIACCEAACRALEGSSIEAARTTEASVVAGWVGGVPEGKEHCPRLVAGAMRGIRALAEEGAAGELAAK